MLERGLAYRRRATSTGAPSAGPSSPTSRSIDGRCWRCDDPVERARARAVVLPHHRLRRRAARAISTGSTGWPERVVTMQRNWIGRSDGAEVDFPLDGRRRRGRSGLHHAPRHPLRRHLRGPRAEHPLVATIVRDAGARRGSRASSTRVRERQAARSGRRRRKASSPAPTAVNPFTGARIPVWVGELRAHGVRHGRGHGGAGARPARLRVRAGATISRSAS